MNTIRKFTLLILYIVLILGVTGCYVTGKKDNGNHKGWFKNTNNPHNPGYKNSKSSKKNKKSKENPQTSIQDRNQTFNYLDSIVVAYKDGYSVMERMI